MSETRPRLSAFALREGDAVAVVAPGGLFDAAKVRAGMVWLRTLGLVPVPGRRLFAKDLIFAGTVAQRAADLREAFARADVKAVWCARGGYGAYAVAQELARDRAPKAAKLLIGHSDVTALHLLLARWGWRSLHASCLDRLGDARASRGERALLRDRLLGAGVPPRERGLRSLGGPGEARAPLIGGNLTLLAASLGSAWEVQARGKILFLEEVGERAYRIDRLLTQLRSAGKLAGLRGALLGDFTDCDEPDRRRLWPEILRRHFKNAPYPVLAGLRAGHGSVRRPVPLGAPVFLRGGRRPLLELPG